MTVTRLPFDRLTFSPEFEWEDDKYLKTLRARGSRRRFLFTGRHKYNTEFGWGKEYFHPNFGWWHLASSYFFCCLPQNEKQYWDTKGKTYLDLGCGDSADAAFANGELGMQSFSIDLFPPSETQFPYREKFTFIRSDMVECTPMKPDSVDAATCAAVIDLIKPSERLLFYRNVYDCLKSGAKFVVTIQKLNRGWGVSGLEERERLCRAGFRILCNSVSNRVVATKP